MKIEKKHKLYIRHKDTGQLRNLNRYNKNLYVFIIIKFLTEGYNQKYNIFNKGVKKWTDWRPIDLMIPKNLIPDLEKLKKQGWEVEISYDGSWRPLCTLKDYVEPEEEVVSEGTQSEVNAVE